MLYTSDLEKANVLGDYFQSVYTIEETYNLKQAAQRLQGERNPESLDTVMFTPEDVFNELCRINPAKSCGPDQLPGRLLTMTMMTPCGVIGWETVKHVILSSRSGNIVLCTL